MKPRRRLAPPSEAAYPPDGGAGDGHLRAEGFTGSDMPTGLRGEQLYQRFEIPLVPEPQKPDYGADGERRSLYVERPGSTPLVCRSRMVDT